MLKKLTLGVILAFVLLNVVIAIFAFMATRNRDLSIPDTAVEFQQAVFGGNYEAVWDLSAPEYRNGLTREQFIERQRENSPEIDRLFDWTVLNESSGDIAQAHTRIQLANGGIQTHLLMMRKIDGEWRVTEYGVYDGPWPPDEAPLPGS